MNDHKRKKLYREDQNQFIQFEITLQMIYFSLILFSITSIIMTDIYYLFMRGTNKDFLSFSQFYGVVVSLFYK